MFGPLGVQELIFIFVLALLIFGPKRLPELGRTIGKTLGELRKASNDLRRTINAELIQEELRDSDPRRMVRDSIRDAKEGLERSLRDEPRKPDVPPAAAPSPSPDGSVARGKPSDEATESPADGAASNTSTGDSSGEVTPQSKTSSES